MYPRKYCFLFLITLLANINLQSKTLFLFSHGFGGDKNQISYYKSLNCMNWNIIGKNSFSFNFPEVLKGGKTDRSKANFAQENDIKALENAYYKCLEDKKVDKIVLVGVSRGASTVINFAAKKPPKLAALILEAPFDTLESVIEHALKQKHISLLKKVAYKTIYKLFPSYNPKGPKPIKLVKYLRLNLPILIIHAYTDNLVPVQSSKRLFAKIKEQGNKNAYFLELIHGKHAKYQWSQESYRYQATVHAFYKRYEIEHNKALAQDGEDYLLRCCPNSFL